METAQGLCLPVRGLARTDMPNAHEVRRFWAYRLSRGRYRKFFDVREAMRSFRCFACGAGGVMLDRAHIRPLWAGGGNDVWNLHLLCKVCHIESEDIWDRPYWRWLLARSYDDVMDLQEGARVFGQGVPTMPGTAL